MLLNKPKKLKQGDKVAIVSLSSGLLGENSVKHQLQLGIKRMKELGLEPVFMPNTLKGLAYIHNNPQARANDLKQAFIDNSIKGIICAIGGEDTFRTIPYLMEDQQFRELIKNNPKIFIGFSDSTNNHLMFNKLGLVTYYGLNFLSDLCELQTEMLDYTTQSYLRFFHNAETFTLTPSPVWFKNRLTYTEDQIGVNLHTNEEKVGHEFLFGSNKVTGVLWGGCLDSLFDIYTSTRYENQRAIYDKYDLIPAKTFFKDKILFLETSEERPNPALFEQMLNILLKEGLLNNAKALLVGKPYDEVYYQAYKDILKKFALQLNLPIVYNLNFGHSLPRAVIPYGLNCEIDFKQQTIRIIEKMFA